MPSASRRTDARHEIQCQLANWAVNRPRPERGHRRHPVGGAALLAPERQPHEDREQHGQEAWQGHQRLRADRQAERQQQRDRPPRPRRRAAAAGRRPTQAATANTSDAEQHQVDRGDPVRVAGRLLEVDDLALARDELARAVHGRDEPVPGARRAARDSSRDQASWTSRKRSASPSARPRKSAYAASPSGASRTQAASRGRRARELPPERSAAAASAGRRRCAWPPPPAAQAPAQAQRSVRARVERAHRQQQEQALRVGRAEEERGREHARAAAARAARAAGRARATTSRCSSVSAAEERAPARRA